MKPSEQLTDEQRKRVREIAESSAIQFGSKEGDMFIIGGGGQEDIERAILQALDELVPEMAKDAERLDHIAFRAHENGEVTISRLTDGTCEMLVYGGYIGPCENIRDLCDAAIAQER